MRGICVSKLCVWLCLCLGTTLAIKENYCERNVTVSSLVPVTKQRTVVKQPSKWKLWKKAQQITEFYNTEEEQITHKIITECCPGYLQVESGLCEPICERGCPAYASCVAPQRCQCTAGYVSAVAHRDGSHYCEPTCERSCPTGSHCVAPNTCACKPGHQPQQPNGDAVSAPCTPICQLGDGCANGVCVDVERCVCHRGYLWNALSNSCEQLSPNEAQMQNDDVTELDAYLSSTQSGTGTGTGSGTTAAFVAAECEAGFVLYAGECRAELFESNEATLKDCRQTGCGPHQSCDTAGNCTCNEGYVEEQRENESAKLSCRRTLIDQLLSIDQAANDDDELNTFTIPIIGVASGALFVLIIASLLTGKRRRNAEEPVETQPKEPVLQCEYTQKSYDVDEWVP